MMKRLSLIAVFALACGGSEKSTDMPTQPVETAESQAAVTTPTLPETPQAPAFSLPDASGKIVSLSDYAGKVVVVEWFNPGCPFVKYAYGKGPLKTMANDYAQKGVVWLTINSGAPGKQGADPADNKKAARDWKMGSTILFDKDGKVGQAYGAKTTPHIWVIDQKGGIAYKGALDNAPMGESKDGPYQNYVQMALDSVLAGQPVATSETQSYGCSVKYGS